MNEKVAINRVIKSKRQIVIERGSSSVIPKELKKKLKKCHKVGIGKIGKKSPGLLKTATSFFPGSWMGQFLMMNQKRMFYKTLTSSKLLQRDRFEI